MSGDHVFISYITEDSEAIDELQETLEAADFIVWRDKDKLWPGDDWQAEIRKAIRGGSFVFLACFSSNLSKREKSYQFEELTVAAEEYRLRPPGASWLMTARLDECEIPAVDLGMGRTLGGTIHRADLFGAHKHSQSTRLVLAIQRVMGKHGATATAPASVVDATSGAGRAKSDVVEQVRHLLRNPNLVMDYDEYLANLRAPIVRAMGDREVFPLEVVESTRIDPSFVRGWVSRLRRYDDIVAPALVPVKLITMYGSQVHEQELTRTIQAVAGASLGTGDDIYTSLHQYPALLLTYAAALGALAKNNYSMLRATCADPLVRIPHEGTVPFILTSGSQSIVGIDAWRSLGTIACLEDEGQVVSDEEIDQMTRGAGGRRFSPISDHLHTVLAPVFAQQFTTSSDYAAAFERAEILLDAVSEDARVQISNFWGPHGGYGRYTWRNRRSRTFPEVAMLEEVQLYGSGWTPLLGGLFGGDPERAIAALEAVSSLSASVRSSQR